MRDAAEAGRRPKDSVVPSDSHSLSPLMPLPEYLPLAACPLCLAGFSGLGAEMGLHSSPLFLNKGFAASEEALLSSVLGLALCLGFLHHFRVAE